MKLSQMKIRILIIFVLFLYALYGCKENQNDNSTLIENDKYIKTESGLKYKILKEGNGTKAKNGDYVLLFETTSYRDGTKLYSNENSENPIRIELGANQVTKGVEEGLIGMKSGEVKLLVVPHYLAKREFYPENVSPDSTLVIKLIVDKVIRAQ